MHTGPEPCFSCFSADCGFVCLFVFTMLHSLASLVAQLLKNLPSMQETLVQFLSGKDLLEKDRLPTPIFLGFPGGSAGKEVNSYSLQYSSLENSRLYLDIPGIPGYTVHGVAKSWT